MTEAGQQSEPSGERRQPRSENMDTSSRPSGSRRSPLCCPAAVLIGWGAGALLDKWLHQDWIYIVGLILAQCRDGGGHTAGTERGRHR